MNSAARISIFGSRWAETDGSLSMLNYRVFGTRYYDVSIDDLVHGQSELRYTVVAEFLRHISTLPSWTKDEIARVEYFLREMMTCDDLLPCLHDLCKETSRKIAASACA